MIKKGLETLLDCPVCGAKYDKGRARIVSGKEDALLVHTNCQKCNTNSLAMLSKNNMLGDGMVTMGMMTDLYYDEALMMLGKEPVSAEEVLQVFEKFSSLEWE
jgi:hypothetical protein